MLRCFADVKDGQPPPPPTVSWHVFCCAAVLDEAANFVGLTGTIIAGILRALADLLTHRGAGQITCPVSRNKRHLFCTLCVYFVTSLRDTPRCCCPATPISLLLL